MIGSKFSGSFPHSIFCHGARLKSYDSIGMILNGGIENGRRWGEGILVEEKLGYSIYGTIWSIQWVDMDIVQ